MRFSIRVTVPKYIFNSDALVAALKSLLRNTTAPEISDLFQATTEGWQQKPGWFQKFNFAPDRLATMVYPVGQAANIYALVNAGSPAHPIAARRGLLRFQRGYRAATSPGVLTSRPKARFGAFVQTRLVPRHPGFAPRHFDETIADRYQPNFERDVQRVFETVAHY